MVQEIQAISESERFESGVGFVLYSFSSNIKAASTGTRSCIEESSRVSFVL